MVHPFDDPGGPLGPADNVVKRKVPIGKAGPNPARAAQFAALTFLLGVGFLLVGYMLS